MTSIPTLGVMPDEEYRHLFHRSPMAIFVEDFSGVASWFEELRSAGITDFRAALATSPELMEEARQRVVVNDINDTAVDMFGETVRQTLVSGVQIDSEAAEEGFAEQLVALWEGRARVDIEFPSLYGSTGPIDCLLSWSVRELDDGSLDPSHVVVTVADISEQKAADRQVERRVAQLQLLHDVSLEISAQRSVDGIFRRIVDGAAEVLVADQARLLLLTDDGTDLLADVTAIQPGISARALSALSEIREGIAGWVLEHGEPTLSADVEMDSRNRGAALEAARSGQFAALAMAPLVVDAKVVGTLTVLRCRGEATFRAEDLHVLTTLATHAGYAIQSARLLDSLERSVASRDRLLALVSHELRTPLTAMIGMASTVRDNAAVLEPSELTRFAAVIVDQGKDLAGIVEDLLSSAAADAGALDVRAGPVDLWEQVAAVATSLGERAESVGDVVDVTADALRVRQIVRNLISNARRHGGPHLRITVSSEGEWGVVEVADDGAGVPGELQPRLFEPFEHGGSHHESTGLGLSVSRDLAERMGGSITYRRIAGWSTFRVSLPRSSQAT